MKIHGADRNYVDLSIGDDLTGIGRTGILLRLRGYASDDGKAASLVLDENHAHALALALEAAVCEIQARAVSP